MNALLFAQVAKDHFEAIAPKNIVNGYEKFASTSPSACNEKERSNRDSSEAPTAIISVK